MAQNGETEPKTEETPESMETEESGTNGDDTKPSEGYTKLIEYGINKKVAEALDDIYRSTDLLSHGDLDERALDALKEFPVDGGLVVLKQFREANLEHVGNKSAFLCGVMKTYRQRKSLDPHKGPDEAKLKEILDRTGYQLDITTGQRKYGGPPPSWDGGQPGAGHEVFCGKVPKDMFEDELIPLFDKCGKIWDLRLMMDPLTGFNRGYCFVTFCHRDGATEATKQLDNHEIRPGKKLKVNVSIANLRLFVGNIPKGKSREEIKNEFAQLTEGLIDVIIYSSPDDPRRKNRGFAFLEYENHKMASTAKRKLSSGRIKVWGCDIIVDWADPQEEPDEETMSKVKILYVRNLKSDVTEQMLQEKFATFGEIEKTKKIKDYGFIHFKERDDAVRAMDELNGKELSGTNMEISLAKPPSENKAKNKRRRDEEKRILMGGREFDMWPGPGRSRPPMGPGMRGMMRGRGRGGMGPGPGETNSFFGGPGGGGGGAHFRNFGGDGFGYGNEPFYDDFYSGYDDYYEGGGYGGGYGGPGPRGPRRGGPMGPPAPRGRGGMPPPRRGRGGPQQMRARGSRGRGMPSRGPQAGRGGMQQRGNKRKAGGDPNQGQNKRRNTSQDNSWGAQPIAQQPLQQSEWYQDSYDQQW